jgi:hypothetical protein
MRAQMRDGGHVVDAAPRVTRLWGRLVCRAPTQSAEDECGEADEEEAHLVVQVLDAFGAAVAALEQIAAVDPLGGPDVGVATGETHGYAAISTISNVGARARRSKNRSASERGSGSSLQYQQPLSVQVERCSKSMSDSAASE